MKAMIKQITPVLLGLLLADGALAEPLTQLSLKLEKLQRGTRNGDQVATLDLLNEAKRQNSVLQNLPSFDLNRVEVMMKSHIGGAAAYLVVNNQIVDSNSVETDPDLFAKPGGEAKVELKNLERRVDTAALSVVGRSSIASVTIFFGAITEPAILGSYATGDATAVGDATPKPVYAVRPPEALRPGSTQAGQLLEPHQPTVVIPQSSRPTSPPVVVAPPTTRPTQPGGVPSLPPPIDITPGGGPVVIAPPVQQTNWEDLNCVQGICVGDTVLNNFGFDGIVRRVFVQQGTIEVKFNFSANPQIRQPSQVKLKARGRRG